MSNHLFTSGFCLYLISAAACHGTLLFSDAFGYADGPITTVSGGVWTADSGTNDPANALPVFSGQAQISRSRNECVHAALGQTFSTSSGAVLYAGFTINLTTLPARGGGYFLQYNFTSSTLRCRVLSTISNAAPGYYRLSIGNSSGVSPVSGQWTNDLATNTTYTVVTRYGVGTGISTLWINPTAETDSSITATDTPAPTSISSIRLRQAGSMGIILLDNLKIGTTFADVIGTQSPGLTTICRTNQSVSLQWNSCAGANYLVQTSSNLTTWSVLASNLTATGTNCAFTTNLTDNLRFFRVAH